MQFDLKKNQPFILAGVGLLLVVVLGGGIFAYSRSGGQPEPSPTPAPKKKKVVAPVNVIPVGERPYVYVSPVADGQNIEITIAEVKKPATEAELVLEYQAGSTLQGFSDLAKLDSLPVTAKKLLGSCSAGGACTYHKDIKGGFLQINFNGAEAYSLKQEWKYFDNWGAAKTTTFDSKDQKFSINSADLGKQRFVIVYNSPGYAKGLEKDPTSEIYAVSGVGALAGKATVSFTTEATTGTIMGYDGKAWNKLETTFAGGKATGEGGLYQLYALME
jgi:hypothetical protein